MIFKTIVFWCEDLISGTAISKIYELKANKKLSSEKVYEKFKENDEIALKVINGSLNLLQKLYQI